IRHHDELIGRLLETAAGRRRELIRDGAEPPAASVLLSPTQLDALRGRFEFVLEVRCELGSRPPARG
ncbi:MAG TPA: hypothetical protein VMU66_01335, partial [Gaiellales bacterium]|nr:hypothetical protein [Gaiellales bacterium]